ALRRDFAAFVRWVVAESGVEPATYADLAASRRPGPGWLSRADLAGLARSPVEDAEALGLAGQPGAATGERALPRRAAGGWVSPAEQLAALCRAGAALDGEPAGWPAGRGVRAEAGSASRAVAAEGGSVRRAAAAEGGSAGRAVAAEGS